MLYILNQSKGQFFQLLSLRVKKENLISLIKKKNVCFIIKNIFLVLSTLMHYLKQIIFMTPGKTVFSSFTLFSILEDFLHFNTIQRIDNFGWMRLFFLSHAFNEMDQRIINLSHAYMDKDLQK